MEHVAVQGLSGEDRGQRTVLPVLRYRIRVRGQVQGVGFRPYVLRLATERSLSGWVRNDTEGVLLEVQGPRDRLDDFLERLPREAPPLARVEAVAWQAVPVPAAPTPTRKRQDNAGFHILASTDGVVTTGITPDWAVCSACLAELFDPGNRRYRYPFINCTHCGPRYTLTRALPYDRPNTSMAAFRQCPPCQSEYEDPAQRRFHAQPNACPDCGPRLTLLESDGRPWSAAAGAGAGAAAGVGAGAAAGVGGATAGTPTAGGRAGDVAADPVCEAVRRLHAGEILAVKGLGGFHLLCDAFQPAAVARLRQRKHREAKPLAVMAAAVPALLPWVEISPAEQEWLEDGSRPIVLLRKRHAQTDPLPGVAPGLAWLGALLAYTPLHYLLFHAAAGQPVGTDWLHHSTALWVCTSANPGGEPLVTGNDEAVQRLQGIADAFLVHDRDILIRCDDSVVRHGVEGTTFLRRARGFTPVAIRLPQAGPSVLALGGWLKNTACLTRADQAFLTQHIGDLDNAATCRALDSAVEHLQRVLRIQPAVVACDRHPDFYSTHLAQRLATEWDVPLVRVQHHHAHLAAVQAEHRLSGPVLGVAMDGVGLGLDGTPWGGELLWLEGTQCTRLGHLRPLALPGGDRAALEPWRMAAAALHALGKTQDIPARFPEQPLAADIAALLRQGVRCPLTTSLGRHFDAVAGLLGIQPVARFEGQAAMRLEGVADAQGPARSLGAGVGWCLREGNELDLHPLLAWVAQEAAAPAGRAEGVQDTHSGEPLQTLLPVAAVFHATLAEALATWVMRAAEATGVRDVVFGGGCVLNQVLLRDLLPVLSAAGYRVHLPRQAPANDGGLSLGQAWVALQHLQAGTLEGMRPAIFQST